MKTSTTIKRRQTSKKSIKLPTVCWKWNSKKGEKFFEKPTIDSTEVLISGKLVTLLILSFVSGIIDLVFFSELSKSVFKIATVSVAAGIVYTLMSIGFTSAKFWCATQLSVIKELQARLKENGLPFKALNKPKMRWNVIHKFLIGVSLITAISLSVVSIGDAVRKNQNEILKAKQAYEKIAKYSNTADVSDDAQFKALVKGTNASSNAADTAATQAARIWPIIEDYRTERAEFEAEFGNNFSSKEEVVFKGQTIIPDTYWDKQNSLVQSKIKAAGRNLSISQIRNITSEAVLASQIKKEIEASVANTSLDSLTELADKTNNKAKQEIENLEGRFNWPDGSPVIFDPNNISKSLQTLGDIQSAYENDSGDVGQSAKMFMIIGPALESKFANKATLENITEQKVSTNSFGTTEVMMMILIMIFGIVQEFIIALYTPKSTIDRRTLSQFSEYLDLKEMENKGLDVNRFLIKIYNNYLDDGSYSQAKYDYKMEKVIDVVAKRNSNWIEHEIEAKTKYYTSLYDEKASSEEAKQQAVIEELYRQIAELKAQLDPEPVKAVDLSRVPLATIQEQLKQLAVEVPMDRPRWDEISKTLQQRSVFVGETLNAQGKDTVSQEITINSENPSILEKKQNEHSNKVDEEKSLKEAAIQEPVAKTTENRVTEPEEYSKAVDDAINEIEELLNDEDN